MNDVNATQTHACLGKLGSVDTRISFPISQHAISYEAGMEVIKILDGGAESMNAALQLATDKGIIDQETCDTVSFMLSTSPQVPPEEAYALAMKLQADVGYTPAEGGYPIAGSNVTKFYGALTEIEKPEKGQPFYGQDAHYPAACSYVDNGDGTITDNITGLMWQKDPGLKMPWIEAVNGLEDFNKEGLGGHSDWRLPTIKELYSITHFSGYMTMDEADCLPYADTSFFKLRNDYVPGDRFIDSQMITTSIFRGKTFGGTTTMFGFNIVDGRIKGYPSTKRFYCYHVRGNKNYGQNMLVDNGDGTISDLATGLMWMTADSGYFNAGDACNGTMDWEGALTWCENLAFAGYDDWKLPNSKELQSIVDYSRGPDSTNSPAINPMFYCTPIMNTAGLQDWGYYWTSTPFLFEMHDDAVYVCFGRGMGNAGAHSMDVHGAGCQRSDPRCGSRSFYPVVDPMAPQGDELRVFNMVRAVRHIKK